MLNGKSDQQINYMLCMVTSKTCNEMELHFNSKHAKYGDKLNLCTALGKLL